MKMLIWLSEAYVSSKHLPSLFQFFWSLITGKSKRMQYSVAGWDSGGALPSWERSVDYKDSRIISAISLQIWCFSTLVFVFLIDSSYQLGQVITGT